MSLRPFNPDIDNESVYDEKISPLMAQIIAICKEHSIPLVATFEFAEGSTCDTVLLPEGCSERLTAAAKLIRHREPLYAFTIMTKVKP